MNSLSFVQCGLERDENIGSGLLGNLPVVLSRCGPTKVNVHGVHKTPEEVGKGDTISCAVGGAPGIPVVTKLCLGSLENLVETNLDGSKKLRKSAAISS